MGKPCKDFEIVFDVSAEAGADVANSRMGVRAGRGPTPTGPDAEIIPPDPIIRRGEPTNPPVGNAPGRTHAEKQFHHGLLR